MPSFEEAYKLLVKAEYSNNPNNFLHINKEEDGFTLGGIYSKWHPKAIDWSFITRVYEMNRRDIKKTSQCLYWDVPTQSQVFTAFKQKYWIKHKLGQIHSQAIANKLLLAIVNVDIDAVKYIQRIVGEDDDGIIGQITLDAINSESEYFVLKEFNDAMLKHYDEVIENNPKLAFNKNGWEARLEIC